MFGLPAYIDQIVRAGVLGAICLAFIILAVRLVGLRSFSKMTAFDFVITLATGSLLATATVATPGVKGRGKEKPPTRRY